MAPENGPGDAVAIRAGSTSADGREIIRPDCGAWIAARVMRPYTPAEVAARVAAHQCGRR